MDPRIIMVGGIITLTCFLITAFIGFSLTKGNSKFTFKHHIWMARISVTLGLIHAIAGIIIVLGL